VLTGFSEAAAGAAREPLDLERDGPLSFTWVTSPSSSSLVVRAHPAFFDTESMAIALRDLAAAYGTLKAGGDPWSGRRASDYGALAAWERSDAGRDARHRFESRWRGWTPPVDGRGPTPDCHAEGARLGTLTRSWSRADTTALDGVARRLGVTPCAVLLGCFAMDAARLSDLVIVDCPVSTRATLGGEGVIGPFAVDMPLHFCRNTLQDLPSAAIAASTAIADLFDVLPFPSQRWLEESDGSGFAFTYLDRLPDLSVPWGRAVRRAVLHAAPLWSALKLSASRKGGDLELTLIRDPAKAGPEADVIVQGMRQRVLEWHSR
jgi:hypothetical protein